MVPKRVSMTHHQGPAITRIFFHKQEEPQIKSISISSQRKLRGKHKSYLQRQNFHRCVEQNIPWMFLVATMEQITGKTNKNKNMNQT